MPITYVATQLGHKKPTTTLQWYAHYLPKATARYVEWLDDGHAAGVVPATDGTNFGTNEEPTDSPPPPSTEGLGERWADGGSNSEPAD